MWVGPYLLGWQVAAAWEVLAMAVTAFWLGAPHPGRGTAGDWR